MATIVSAYFDVPSKMARHAYIEHIRRFMQLEANIVFFTSHDLLPIFQAMRTNNIVYVLMDINNLESIKKYGYHQWLYWSLHHFPEHYNKPYLGAIWYDKKDFVLKAIDMNPFNSEVFIWCDAGCIRDESWFPIAKRFGFRLDVIPRTKVLLQRIEYHWPDGYIIAGAIMAGNKDVWSQYNDCFNDTFDKIIARGQNPYQDQYVAWQAAVAYPNTIQMMWDSESDKPFFDRWFFFLTYLSDA